MRTFKTWLEEGEVGEPRGSKVTASDNAAAKMANKVLSRNPTFTTKIATAPNDKAKLNTINRVTAKALKRSPAAGRAGVTPDLVSRHIGDATGADFKSLVGMKKQ